MITTPKYDAMQIIPQKNVSDAKHKSFCPREGTASSTSQGERLYESTAVQHISRGITLFKLSIYITYFEYNCFYLFLLHLPHTNGARQYQHCR
jgi:hypothetical protein